MNNSLPMVTSSPITTNSNYSTCYRTGNSGISRMIFSLLYFPLSYDSNCFLDLSFPLPLPLPFPLLWDVNYLEDIGLNGTAFFEFCRSNPDLVMMPNPVQLVFKFIDDCIEKSSSFGLNDQCLSHLISTKDIEQIGEPLEAYIFDYVEHRILKSIDYPTFESPPDK